MAFVMQSLIEARVSYASSNFLHIAKLNTTQNLATGYSAELIQAIQVSQETSLHELRILILCMYLK